MILDRNIVSKNFLYKDGDLQLRDLFARIDYWKNILVNKCQAQKGQTIALGITRIDFDYFAITFASLELGLLFVVLDYSSLADELGIKDFKNDVYGDIDIFLHKLDERNSDKLKYYSKRSKKIYDVKDLRNCDIEISAAINAIRPDPEDYMLFCTSSGTTGTPKIVKHTHGFMYELVQRNKKLYSGSVLHIRNLHHGSSLAVFFLPVLASDNVSFHTCFGYDKQTEYELNQVAEAAEKYKIQNISFPFSVDIDMFLQIAKKKQRNFNDLNLFTLSYIDPNWNNFFDLGIHKFESIFGCNETSGPLFLSQLKKDKPFDAREFAQIDNFYKFDAQQEKLNVHMPVYNSIIEMNDIFEMQPTHWPMVNGIFIHKGRCDIVKINQVELNLQEVSNIPNMFDIDGEIITDTIYNKLYLALWSDTDKTKISKLKEHINQINPRLQIDQWQHINKNNFLRGIKIDKEMIRDYFRC